MSGHTTEMNPMSNDRTVLGGTLGGLHRRDIPDRVATLLAWYPQTVELRIRPEVAWSADDHHYAIDWQVLDPEMDDEG